MRSTEEYRLGDFGERAFAIRICHPERCCDVHCVALAPWLVIEAKKALTSPGQGPRIQKFYFSNLARRQQIMFMLSTY